MMRIRRALEPPGPPYTRSAFLHRAFLVSTRRKEEVKWLDKDMAEACADCGSAKVLTAAKQ